MKLVDEVLGKIKGASNIKDTLTGKGSFSKQGFSDLTSAMINDNSFKVKSFGKDGQTIETSLSELIRSDLKKTLANAKYPQKSEAGVLDTCEVFSEGLAAAIPFIVSEQIRCGKKFDLPAQKDMVGSIYLAKNPAKVRTMQVRDIKTKRRAGYNYYHYTG